MWLKKLYPNDARVECGLHSGFPSCCVLFYVTVWNKLYPSNMKLVAAYHKLSDYMAKKRNVNSQCYLSDLDESIPLNFFNRVACPYCLFFGSKEAKCLPCKCGTRD